MVQPRPDLTVSIISADNSTLLLPCLHSIYANTHKTTVELFVVDNASTDGTGQAAAETFPDISVIHNSTRQGFSTNNNLVLQQGTGRYLMLLNDDTLLRNDALDQMVAFMDQNPQAGAAGAFLFNPDNSFQAAFARFPRPITEGLLPTAIWSYKFQRQMTVPFAVDTVCGAAMIVRREAVEQVGLLDTDFDPIYSEEVEWCYRIKQAGWKIYTIPQAQIVHYGSQTMNRVVPRKYELLLSKKALFFRKHSSKLGSSLFKIALSISTTIKLLFWSGLGLVRYPGSSEKRHLHWYLLKRIPKL